MSIFKLTKRKVVYLSVFGLIALCIIGVIIYFIWKINQPVTATLKAGKTTSSVPTYKLNLSPKLMTGKYISFDYPTSLVSRTPSPLAGPEVENFYFTFKDVQTWVLAIVVSTTKTGQFSDSSSYTLEEDSPSEYSRTSEVINNQEFAIFTDLNAPAFSQTAFVLHGNMLASISLQGDDTAGSQPLQKSFNMIISSLTWN